MTPSGVRATSSCLIGAAITAPGIKRATTARTCIGLRIDFTLPRILAVPFPKQAWVRQKILRSALFVTPLLMVDVDLSGSSVVTHVTRLLRFEEDVLITVVDASSGDAIKAYCPMA